MGVLFETGRVGYHENKPPNELHAFGGLVFLFSGGIARVAADKTAAACPFWTPTEKKQEKIL